MQFRGLHFLLSLFLLLQYLPISEAQDPVLDLYINNGAISSSLDGTKENPYLQLSDAFAAIKDRSSPASQINLYIASSSVPYNLNDSEYIIDNQKTSSLIMNLWINNSSDDVNASIPTVNFEASSLVLGDIDLFAIYSINITGDGESLILKNSTLLLQDLEIGLNSEFDHSMINIQDGTSVILENVKIHQHSSGCLLNYSSIDSLNSADVLLENVTIILGEKIEENSSELLALKSNTDNIKGNVTILNLKVMSQNGTSNELPTLLKAVGFYSVLISNLSIFNELLYIKTQKSIIALEDIINAGLNGLLLSNNTMNINSTEAIISIHDIINLTVQNIDFSNNYIVADQDDYITLFDVFNVKNVSLISQFINQNSFNLSNFGFYNIDSDLQTTDNMSLDIDDIHLSDNKGTLYKNSLTYLALQEAQLERFTVTNLEYSQNSITGQLFSLQPGLSLKKSIFDPSVSPKAIMLSNVSIIDNANTSNMTFVYFSPSHDQQDKYGCLQPAEAFAIFIDNLTMTNNSYSMSDEDTIYQSSLFQVLQAQFHLNNSVISNNSLDRYTFLTLGTKASTVIITSSKFIGNNMTLSQLVMASGSSGYICSYTGSPLTKVQTPLYRYTFILNSTFMNNYLKSSIMFEVVTGFIALHNNKLINEHFTKSQFITMPFPPPRIEYTLAAAYSRNQIVEQSTLQNNQIASSIFQEIMTLSSSYQSDSIYFTSIYNNNFTNVKHGSSTLLSFAGLTLDQTFIRVENNTFLSLSFSTLDISSLMYFNSLNTMRIVNNMFESIKGKGRLLSLSQSSGFSSLQIDSNSLINSTISTFLTCTANFMKTVEFNNNTITNTTVYISMLSIIAETASNGWIFDSNTIAFDEFDINMYSSQENKIGYIILSCNTASNVSQLLFSNNSIKHMSVVSNDQTKANFFLIDASQSVNFTNLTADSMFIMSQGSFMQVSSSSTISIKNLHITNISTNSEDELISLSTSEILIMNSVIEGYSNQNHQNSIFDIVISSSGTKVDVVDCKFMNIDAASYGTILTAESQSLQTSDYQLELTISNSSFKNVEGMLMLSSITCKGCVIKDVSFAVGRDNELIYFKNGVSGDITLENIKLTLPNISNEDFLPLIYISDSLITITVDNMECLNKGSFSLISMNSGTLIFKNSVFSDIQSSENALINVGSWELTIYTELPENTPQVIIQNVTFQNFNSTNDPFPFDSQQLSWADDPSEFFAGQSRGIITVSMPANITVEGCVFEKLAQLPAIFYVIETDWYEEHLVSEIQIRDSKFKNINFTMGTALTVLPKTRDVFKPVIVTVDIVNSTFEGNRAEIGGALLIYNSSLSIMDSQFRNNSANIIGDHIFLGDSSEKDEKITNCIFDDSLDFKHEKIAYQPTGFNITFVFDDFKSVQLELSEFRLSWLEGSLTNVSSEEISQAYLRLDFKDDYENSAWDFSNERSATFLIPDNSNYNLSTSFDAQILPTDGISLNISLSNLVVAGEAGTKVRFLFEYSSTRLQESLFLHITLRSCLPGEYNNSVMCLPCAENTFSFDPSQPCAKCPPNANCRAQSQICPTLGFWNSRTNSTALHQCHPGRCLNDQDCITCASGYAGPLCDACDFNSSYVEKGYLKCGKCQDPQISLILTILAALLYFAYQLFSIHVLYTGDRKIPKVNTEFLTLRKLERSYYIKSLLTYTQLMSTLYLSSYELYNSLGLTLHFGNPSVLITYGTQCSLTALGVQSADFLYYQTYFQVLYPIIQFAVISLFFVLAKLVWRSLKCKRLITITALYLIISNQTGIVNSLGLFLSCGTLDDLGYSFVTAHPNWSCDTDQYTSFAQVFVMPSLVLWCGVIPISLLLILYVNRQSLTTKKSKGSFGILLSGLRSQYYFWGILLMALKLALSFLIISLQQKNQTRIFLSLVLLWAYQSLVRALQPYDNPSFNRFQIILMNLLMFNIIVTQYLIDPSNGQTLSEICVVICAIGNGSVVLYMCWKVVSLTFLRVVAFVEKKVMKRKVEKDSLLISGVKRRDTLIEANGVN